jgi:galactokinase
MDERTQRSFRAVFGREPSGAARAPGRVNLIGEHTDYNGGLVLPIAIEPEAVAAYAAREDREVHFRSVYAGETFVTDLDAELTPQAGHWSNYPAGVVRELRAAGVALAGTDVLIDSTVPVGGGLSSSAAIEVATALALMASAGRPEAVAGAELARLCQRAENEFAGAPCGIMDQSIVVLARAGRAMLMDCRDGEVRHVPFDDPAVTLLVVDTQVKHNVGEGGYPLRRRQCEQAAGALGVASLREVTPVELAEVVEAGGLDATLLARVRHVVGEIDRTAQAAEALARGDWRGFGRLMFASHRSLRDDYEVSSAELDAIVESAGECEGVYGARMTGGGFGGCAIILAEADAAEAVGRRVADRFEAAFHRRPPILATAAAAGAGVLR